MNICAISPINFSCNAPKVVKYYVPGKNDTTLRCFITGTLEKTTNFKYDVLKKGKVIESKEFHNKRGFSLERFAVILDKMQEKAREGYNFMHMTYDAQLNGGN